VFYLYFYPSGGHALIEPGEVLPLLRLEGDLLDLTPDGVQERFSRPPLETFPSGGPYTGEVQVSVNRILEPSTFIIWSVLGAVGVTVGWWRRRRKA
jgi:hypothetical protein